MSLTTDIGAIAQKVAVRMDRHKRKGIAALEFALTLPIWVALLIGVTDGAYMMLLSQRTDRIAYTVTDLVTQLEEATANDVDTILLAAGQLMEPFPFGEKGVVIVSSIYKEPGQPVSIRWQRIGGGSLARASKIGEKCSVPNLPQGLTINDKENVIVSEVYYAYEPMFINAGVFEAKDFYRVAVYKPRLGKLIIDPWGGTC